MLLLLLHLHQYLLLIHQFLISIILFQHVLDILLIMLLVLGELPTQLFPVAARRQIKNLVHICVDEPYQVALGLLVLLIVVISRLLMQCFQLERVTVIRQRQVLFFRPYFHFDGLF